MEIHPNIMNFHESSMNYPTRKKPKSAAFRLLLDEALDNLEADHDFLLQGDVFTKSFLENYIAFKREEAKEVSIRPPSAQIHAVL